MSTLSLCVCLDAVFARNPTDEALHRIAALGWRHIEFWDWKVREIEALAQLAAGLGLEVVIFSGNTFEEPLVDGELHERAMTRLKQSLQVAQRLGVRLLVMHVGYALKGRSQAEQWRAAVRGLRAAGTLAQASGVTLAVEPLNSKVDHPGYFLDSLEDARRLVDEVAHPGVRLLIDVYHMQLMHDDLLRRLPEVLPYAAHVHVADVPGRHEPGSGRIPWPAVMEILRDKYDGVIGLECWPRGEPEDALRRSAEVLRA